MGYTPIAGVCNPGVGGTGVVVDGRPGAARMDVRKLLGMTGVPIG